VSRFNELAFGSFATSPATGPFSSKENFSCSLTLAPNAERLLKALREILAEVSELDRTRYVEVDFK
jgi:hypothetical protein